MRTNTIRYLVTAFLFIVAQYTAMSQNWIPLGTSSEEICLNCETIKSDSSSFVLHVSISGLYDTVVKHNGTEFHQLSLGLDDYLQTIGEPALPLIKKNIGIPNGCAYSIEILDEQWVDVPTGKIEPTQEPSTSISQPSFAISHSVYSSEVYSHPILIESAINIWKGIRNVVLSVCPFVYYPSGNKLSVMKDFTLSVSFMPDASVERNVPMIEERDLDLFDNTGFSEYHENPIQRVARVQDNINYDYLIIVGNTPTIENSQAMKNFRKWKALKGYKTKMVSTSTIGSDTASIKQYIINEYSNGVRQVLLVGDQTKIPIPHIQPKFKLTNFPSLLSDYWYGCLDGDNDNQAEIPIGRFVANSLGAFENIVNKTIAYEGKPSDCTHKSLLVAHSQQDDVVNYQEHLEMIRNKTYAEPLTFSTAYAASLENGGDHALVPDVYAYFEEGFNLVTHNGHALPHEIWMNTADTTTVFYNNFQAKDTARINNSVPFVFLTTGCQNGNFTGYKSLMRAFTESSRCAVAYLACTYPVFTYSANDFLKKFYDNLLNKSYYNIGELNLTTHVGLGLSPEVLNNAFGYVCAADPSLELWTGRQHEFNNVEMSVLQDSLIIKVTDTENYNINIVSSDALLIGKYTMCNGTVKIPLQGNISLIGIDKHNYIPLVIHVNTDTNYIQNENIYDNRIYTAGPLSIGRDVDDSNPFGNVTIHSNSRVLIQNGYGTIIKNGFECKKGSILTILP